MSDDWLSDVLHRVDKRCARQDAEREGFAGQFSGIYWLAFWIIALGLPAGLWRYGPDLTGLIGAVW